MWAACDDRWHEDYVASLLCELESNPGAGLVMSALSYYNEAREKHREHYFPEDDNPNNWSTAMPLI